MTITVLDTSPQRRAGPARRSRGSTAADPDARVDAHRSEGQLIIPATLVQRALFALQEADIVAIQAVAGTGLTTARASAVRAAGDGFRRLRHLQLVRTRPLLPGLDVTVELAVFALLGRGAQIE